MMNKKKIIIFAVFILIIFFVMVTFAGESVQNAEVITRKVIFTDGFNGKEITSYEVEVGSYVTAPKAPTHENYVFAGWFDYSDRTTKVESFNNILKDTHVIGIYGEDINKNGKIDSEEEHYLVAFIDTVNGSTIKEESVLPGMSATAPEAPVISGYIFKGWDISYTNVQKDLYVSTVYESEVVEEEEIIKTYNVTFIDGDTNKTISVVNVEEGKNAKVPNTPKHEDRLFDYWDGTYTNVKSDQKVIAIYTDDKNHNNEKDYLDHYYTIKFTSVGNGHLDGELEYSGILEGLTFEEAKINIPEIIADEYHKFSNWDNEFDKDTKIIGDITYTGYFVPINDENKNEIADENEYRTITYKDGLDEMVFSDVIFEKQLDGFDTPLFNEGNDPVREGFIFDGWEEEVSEKINGDATYIAKWKEDLNIKTTDSNCENEPDVCDIVIDE